MSTSKKNKNMHSGIIYSTNPTFKMEETSAEIPTPAREKQDLRVMRDSKQRGGKTVTLVTGFQGTNDDLILLGKLLKTKCGTGGSTKDGIIIIQGDMREKIFEILSKEGYPVKKAGG